jgi:hypothetical protein
MNPMGRSAQERIVNALAGTHEFISQFADLSFLKQPRRTAASSCWLTQVFLNMCTVGDGTWRRSPSRDPVGPSVRPWLACVKPYRSPRRIAASAATLVDIVVLCMDTLRFRLARTYRPSVPSAWGQRVFERSLNVPGLFAFPMNGYGVAP